MSADRAHVVDATPLHEGDVLHYCVVCGYEGLAMPPIPCPSPPIAEEER